MARWFVDRLPQRGIPSVSLRRLLPQAQFVGCADWEVSGCSDDHRRLDPGQVFVATRSARPGYDGHAHVREALERGAAGVVVERPCPDAGRLQVVVNDAAAAHARICQALAGDPSRHLLAAAVTGSFGRTLAAVFVRSIFEAAGHRSGLVGALGFFDGEGPHALGAAIRRPGGGPGRTRLDRTDTAFAPDAASLAAMMAEMVDRGCEAAVLEASAEAIEHRAFDGVGLHAALVTDVSAPWGFPEEVRLERRRAKARLVRQVVPGGVVIVNADDPNAEILGGVNLDADRLSYAMEPAARPDRPADLTGRIVRLDADGTRMIVRGLDREITVDLRPVGPRAAACALAAAAMARAMEIDAEAIALGLERVAPVAGRLESINEGQDFDVRVDAAETPEAIAEALIAARAVAAGRVHCVVGAEGGSHPDHRRRIAEAVEACADRITLTSHNPRSEDPDQILDQILAGFRRPGKVRLEPDRRRAIEAVLADARPGDAVLIAGKGRHTYQILADHAVPFDDVAIARAWLRRHARPIRPVTRSA